MIPELAKYDQTGNLSFLMPIKKEEETPFYVRHRLAQDVDNWGPCYHKLARVLDESFPGVVAYIESVFENSGRVNTIFFNYVVNSIGLTVFNNDPLEEKFSLGYNDFIVGNEQPTLPNPVPGILSGEPASDSAENVGGLGKLLISNPKVMNIYKRLQGKIEDSESVSDLSGEESYALDLCLAEAVERELNESGFLLTYHFASKLYLPEDSEGKKIVTSVNDRFVDNEQYWEFGNADEWIQRRSSAFTEDALLKLLTREDHEDLFSEVQFVGKKQIQRALSSNSGDLRRIVRGAMRDVQLNLGFKPIKFIKN